MLLRSQLNVLSTSMTVTYLTNWTVIMTKRRGQGYRCRPHTAKPNAYSSLPPRSLFESQVDFVFQVVFGLQVFLNFQVIFEFQVFFPVDSGQVNILLPSKYN